MAALSPPIAPARASAKPELRIVIEESDPDDKALPEYLTEEKLRNRIAGDLSFYFAYHHGRRSEFLGPEPNKHGFFSWLLGHLEDKEFFNLMFGAFVNAQRLGAVYTNVFKH